MSTVLRRFAVIVLSGTLILGLLGPATASASPAPQRGGLADRVARTKLGFTGASLLKADLLLTTSGPFARSRSGSAARSMPAGATSRLHALAATDIPGSPIPVSPVAGTLDAVSHTDDVYAIDLASGDQLIVSLTGDAGTSFEPAIYGPDATTLTDPQLAHSDSGAYPEEFVYTVPIGKGGTYYIGIDANDTTGNYSFTYNIDASAANDQIPGAAIPASPVHDSLTYLTDEDDVYAVHLNAGQQLRVTIAGAVGTQFQAYLFAPDATDVFADAPLDGSPDSVQTGSFTYTVPAGKTGMYYIDARADTSSGNYTLTYSVGTPALKINYVKSSGPIAYELRSLQSTRFYTSVNTGGVWADLYVKTSRGNIHIYRGAINEVNRNHFFPLWNGKGSDGRRLPTASYDWQMDVTKGGVRTSAKGKIIVSSICVSMHGTVDGMTNEDPGNYDLHDAYLRRGSANLYMHATTAASSDEFVSLIVGPSNYGVLVCDKMFDSDAPFDATAHLWGTLAPKANGVHEMLMAGVEGVTYSFTLTQ